MSTLVEVAKSHSTDSHVSKEHPWFWMALQWFRNHDEVRNMFCECTWTSSFQGAGKFSKSETHNPHHYACSKTKTIPSLLRYDFIGSWECFFPGCCLFIFSETKLITWTRNGRIREHIFKQSRQSNYVTLIQWWHFASRWIHIHLYCYGRQRLIFVVISDEQN